MLMVNVDYIPNKELEVLGIVEGSFMETFSDTSTHSLSTYQELLNTGRQKAIHKMSNEAKRLGGEAIINLRFATHTPINGVVELFVYGTAVKYKISNELQQF